MREVLHTWIPAYKQGSFFVSIKIISWVWDNSPYEGKALLIHLAMADFANDEGVLWPSQVTLARKSRSTERYVRDVTNDMVRDSLLEIVSESNGRDSHRYKLLARNSVPPRNSTTPSPELGDTLPGNPPPKNRKNRKESSIDTTPDDSVVRCPYCRGPVVISEVHRCTAMNMRMR